MVSPTITKLPRFWPVAEGHPRPRTARETRSHVIIDDQANGQNSCLDLVLKVDKHDKKFV